jgi:hypothetical protein
MMTVREGRDWNVRAQCDDYYMRSTESKTPRIGGSIRSYLL